MVQTRDRTLLLEQFKRDARSRNIPKAPVNERGIEYIQLMDINRSSSSSVTVTPTASSAATSGNARARMVVPPTPRWVTIVDSIHHDIDEVKLSCMYLCVARLPSHVRCCSRISTPVVE
jgi:hypothetical protein